MQTNSWKEEFFDSAEQKVAQNSSPLSLGSYQELIDLIVKDFSPYDAPNDAHCGTHGVYFSYTVPIKSIRQSQVTGLLDLTKGHSGHRSQMELTNPFFGSLKRLPKAPKVQKITPRTFRTFSAMKMVH